jgi:hypothetical protein
VVVGVPRRQRLGGVDDGEAVDDGGVGHRARSTERPYRSQPWAQQRGAVGTEVRDGIDDSAHGQGAKAHAALGGEPAGTARWRYRLSRYADQSADCGAAFLRAPDAAGMPAVAGERPLPRVEVQLCPVVCVPTRSMERPIGTAWLLGARHAWCGIPVPASARGALRPYAWKRRRRCKEAHSSSRRAGRSPQAVSAQRSASPDSA